MYIHPQTLEEPENKILLEILAISGEQLPTVNTSVFRLGGQNVQHLLQQ
jgi:hypothetical protein